MAGEKGLKADEAGPGDCAGCERRLREGTGGRTETSFLCWGGARLAVVGYDRRVKETVAPPE